MLVDMARGRIAIQEGSDKSRQNLVSCLGELSDTRMELNRDLESCAKLLYEALSISEAIVAAPKAAPSGLGKNPAYLSKWILANSHFRLGSLLFRKGIGAYGYWGEFLCQTDRHQEGVQVLRDASMMSDQLLKLHLQTNLVNALRQIDRLAQDDCVFFEFRKQVVDRTRVEEINEKPLQGFVSRKTLVN